MGGDSTLRHVSNVSAFHPDLVQVEKIQAALLTTAACLGGKG